MAASMTSVATISPSSFRTARMIIISRPSGACTLSVSLCAWISPADISGSLSSLANAREAAAAPFLRLRSLDCVEQERMAARASAAMMYRNARIRTRTGGNRRSL